MISRIETVDEIKPIFREYLRYMEQFFDLHDHQAWRDTALKHLKRYETETGRYVFVLRESGFVIGFALVNQHLRFNREGFAVAEFYVQKKHERKNCGRQLAEHLFSQFPGHWEVAVSLKNHAARLFWRAVISSYTNGRFVEKKIDSFSGHGFLFNNA